MNDMNQSDKTNKEDPFKIGTVLFSAGDNNHADVWDDSDLIDHWDRNIEAYRNRYSNEAKDPVDNDDPPYQQTKRHKTQAGHITKKKPVLRKKSNMHHSDQSQTSNNASNSKKKETSQEIPTQTSHEQSSFMPPMPPMPSNQEDLSNLIMAWYYCGYYTGLYQAQK